jgi:hypothetical protein
VLPVEFKYAGLERGDEVFLLLDRNFRSLCPRSLASSFTAVGVELAAEDIDFLPECGMSSRRKFGDLHVHRNTHRHVNIGDPIAHASKRHLKTASMHSCASRARVVFKKPPILGGWDMF